VATKIGCRRLHPKQLHPRALGAPRSTEREVPSNLARNISQRKTLPRWDLEQVVARVGALVLELKREPAFVVGGGRYPARIYIDAGRPLKVDIRWSRIGTSPRND